MWGEGGGFSRAYYMPATVLETLHTVISFHFYKILEHINAMLYVRKERLGKEKSLGLISQPAAPGLGHKLKSIRLPAFRFS